MATHGGFCVTDAAQHFSDRYKNAQWECPKVIIIWGNNPVVSNSDGFYGHWIVDMMKMGAKAYCHRSAFNLACFKGRNMAAYSSGDGCGVSAGNDKYNYKKKI